MAGTTSLLLLQGLTGAAGAANAFTNAYAQRARGKAEASLYGADARMADLQAEDAIRRGDVEANRLLYDARRLAAAQRVGYAASGVRVDQGSAADVIGDTATLGALDAAQLKNNAIREAFGYKTKALDSRLSAQLARLQGRYGANASVAQGISGLGVTGLQMKAIQDYYGGLGAKAAGGAGIPAGLSLAVGGAGVPSSFSGVRF